MVQWWTAENEKGNPVHIENAERKKEYVCPDCKGILIPKKGEIVAWHYAHKSKKECWGEGPIHFRMKNIIYDILKNSNLPISDLALEKKREGYLPDISFKFNSITFALEIINTNGPSSEKIKHWGERLIEFNVQGMTDKDMLDMVSINIDLSNKIKHLFGILTGISIKIKELDSIDEKVELGKKELDEINSMLEVENYEQTRIQLQRKIKSQREHLESQKKEYFKYKTYHDSLPTQRDYCYESKCRHPLLLFEFHNFVSGIPSKQDLGTIHVMGGYVHYTWVKNRKRKMWVNYCPKCCRTNMRDY